MPSATRSCAGTASHNRRGTVSGGSRRTNGPRGAPSRGPLALVVWGHGGYFGTGVGGRGEIGRRTSLRSWRGDPSRFESGRSHGVVGFRVRPSTMVALALPLSTRQRRPHAPTPSAPLARQRHGQRLGRVACDHAERGLAHGLRRPLRRPLRGLRRGASAALPFALNGGETVNGVVIGQGAPSRRIHPHREQPRGVPLRKGNRRRRQLLRLHSTPRIARPRRDVAPTMVNAAIPNATSR